MIKKLLILLLLASFASSQNESIMRLRIIDDSLTEHNVCLFYAENHRLAECYELSKINSTIQLLNDKGYEMYVMGGFSDNFNSPGTIWDSLNKLSGYTVAIFILIGLIWILVKK